MQINDFFLSLREKWAFFKKKAVEIQTFLILTFFLEAEHLNISSRDQLGPLYVHI